MISDSPGEITVLLRAWHDGDNRALEHLIDQVNKGLQRIAGTFMSREDPGHLLQSTALINEAYLRLLTMQTVDWQNRSHFFAVSSQVMRHILTDYARSRQALKRGGDVQRVDASYGFDMAMQTDPDLVAINDALYDLARLDSRKSQVVELKFYGGLNFEEIAGVLEVSEVTVRRDWQFAKSWLLRELTRESRLER
jgi:RNA polymerase sigma factor (TIGR02999 family)